jgi:MFS family permease
MIAASAFSPLARRTAITLAVSQCLYFCAIAIGLTLTGLVGSQLAPRASLATMPFAVLTLTSAATTVPLSLLMGRVGRRPVFMLGAFGAIVGGILAAAAIFQRDFILFCVGNAWLGLFQASAHYYRYAATDAVPEAVGKARAVSWVMIGGLVAAFLGPQIAAMSQDFWAIVPFAGSYGAIAALGGIAVFVLATLPAQPVSQTIGGAARPLADLAFQPSFLLGLVCTALAFGIMTFVMTATPLAVVACGFSINASAGVIQAHLVGMFAPAFFTGKLIARFGVVRILLAGLALFGISAAVGLSGLTLPYFTVALVLSGVAWNALFVGGSTLIAQSASAPKDRARLQALSEFSVFGLSAIAAVSAGPAHADLGWAAVLSATFAPLALIGIAVLAFRLTEGRRATAP